MQSLISKLDIVRIWVNTNDADIVVLSETWLTKSVHDKDICIDGYNVFRADRPNKGCWSHNRNMAITEWKQ